MNTYWGKFYGVGVGPGNPQFLTLRAVQVLQEVEIVAIPISRNDRESVAWDIARTHCRPNVELLELEMPMTADKIVLTQAWQTAAEAVLTELRAGKSIAFITLGDPSLYSTYSYLLNHLRPHLPVELIETVPGITAMSAAAARLNIPLAVGDEPLVVLPGTEDVEKFLDLPNLVVLKVSRRLPHLLTAIQQAQKEAILCTRVGQTKEEIRRRPEIPDEGAAKIDYLSLLLVKENPEEGV